MYRKTADFYVDFVSAILLNLFTSSNIFFDGIVNVFYIYDCTICK